MSPALREALARGETPLAVVVEIDFKSERYHTDFLQQQGRISRATADRIWLRAVPRENAQRLARQYWITRISLESEIR
jgi:hypothetical protein